MILAIDPGIRGCGVAVFQESGLLIRAGYLANDTDSDDIVKRCYDMAFVVVRCVRESEHVDTLVVEWPQVYVASKSKGDNNDLLPLAGVDVAVAMILRPQHIKSYKPHEWKGNAPKEVIAARAIERLSEDEKLLIKPCAKSLMHNTYDAIAIGLHYFGRLQKERVIAR